MVNNPMGRRLSNADREGIKEYMLQNTKDMKPKQGARTNCAKIFKVSTRTISSVWERAQKCVADGKLINVKRAYGGNKKPRIIPDLAKIKQIPHKDRTTLRQFAEKYDIGKTTVWHWMQDGLLKSGTSRVHPQLQEHHKISRLKFSLESLMVDADSQIVFKEMSNTVHIDEKWFYMHKLNERDILLPEESVPYKSCQSKNFVPKVMFMCAVCRPVYDLNGELLFDGKIGIFPFVEDVVAMRNSVNRPAGTIETKPVGSVNRIQIRKMIVEKVIPAIKEKWPSCLTKEINIQQDNARPHFKNDDPEFIAAARSGDGFNINLVNQPANSPDTNCNDLGFFASIQSLQQRMNTGSYADLQIAVGLAFNGLEASTLNKVFLSLQMVLVEIMKCKGHNDYKLPHMGKDKLEALGKLPRNLIVDKDLVKDCIAYLLQMGQQINNPILLDCLS